MPMQQRLVGRTASGAGSACFIRGGPMSIPYVVGDHCTKGVGFLHFALRDEFVVNGFGTMEVRKLAVPYATVGRMGRYVVPHVCRKALPDPLQVMGTVHGVAHVHGNGCGLAAVFIRSVPGAGARGCDPQLDEMHDGGRHGGGDVVPALFGVCIDVVGDIVVTSVPGLVNGPEADLPRVEEAKPGFNDHEGVVYVGLGL